MMLLDSQTNFYLLTLYFNSGIKPYGWWQQWYPNETFNLGWMSPEKLNPPKPVKIEVPSNDTKAVGATEDNAVADKDGLGKIQEDEDEDDSSDEESDDEIEEEEMEELEEADREDSATVADGVD